MKQRSLLMCAILSICLLFVSIQDVSASSEKQDENGAYRAALSINGEKKDLKAVIPPSGVTLVPFREFFSILNIHPNFNNNTKTLTATNGETTISLTAGEMTAMMNKKKVSLLQSSSFEEYGVMYVPLRFIAEAFGGKVSFDKSSLRIDVEFDEQ